MQIGAQRSDHFRATCWALKCPPCLLPSSCLRLPQSPSPAMVLTCPSGCRHLFLTVPGLPWGAHLLPQAGETHLHVDTRLLSLTHVPGVRESLHLPAPGWLSLEIHCTTHSSQLHTQTFFFALRPTSPSDVSILVTGGLRQGPESSLIFCGHRQRFAQLSSAVSVPHPPNSCLSPSQRHLCLGASRLFSQPSQPLEVSKLSCSLKLSLIFSLLCQPLGPPVAPKVFVGY